MIAIMLVGRVIYDCFIRKDEEDDDDEEKSGDQKNEKGE